MKTGARGEGRGATYAIRIAGQLGAEWAAWFDGLAITPEANGDTLLTGAVADQAALHGLLRRVRDLGLTLLALNLIVEDHSSAPEHPSNTYHKEES
jgi:hypothetical protein